MVKPTATWLILLILIIAICLSSWLYSFSYILGSIFWISLFGFIIFALLNLRKKKTNKFFKKNKIWIIISVSFVCLLDTLSTYTFIKDNLSNEMNVLQRLLIYIFGTYLGLGIMFLLSIFFLLFLISKLPKKMSKNLFYGTLIIKTLVSYINYSY